MNRKISMALAHSRSRFRMPRRGDKRNLHAVGQVHWIDVWLPRLSHFSQFGLFVLTLGSLYFVVLPLYQKAVLDEAIAKKEIELRELSTALEESYRHVRDSSLKQFLFIVGANCSGLMLPPLNAELIGIHIPDRKPYAQEILEIDPKKCLLAAATQNPGLRSLRSEDMSTLQEAIASTAEELDKKRTEYVNKNKTSWNSRRAKEDANAYAEFVRTRIIALRTLTW